MVKEDNPRDGLITVIDIDIATLDTIVEDPATITATTTTKPSKKSLLLVIFHSNLTIYYENGIILLLTRST